jgi:hypothetical protein
MIILVWKVAIARAMNLNRNQKLPIAHAADDNQDESDAATSSFIHVLPQGNAAEPEYARLSSFPLSTRTLLDKAENLIYPSQIATPWVTRATNGNAEQFRQYFSIFWINANDIGNPPQGGKQKKHERNSWIYENNSFTLHQTIIKVSPIKHSAYCITLLEKQN